MYGIHRNFRRWQYEIHWMDSKAKGKALISVILRCSWAALIYFTWKEINNRRHGKKNSNYNSPYNENSQHFQVQL